MERKVTKGYWTVYENCYNAAKECSTKMEFKSKYPNAYRNSMNNNWFENFEWLGERCKPNGYWNKETCYKAAIECKTRREFSEKYSKAYKMSKKNGWIDEYNWMKRTINPYSSGRDNVYAYFFNEKHAVYIGRTINPQRRNNDHHKSGSVYNFSKENSINIPDMVIIESGITVTEGLDKEDFYVNKYISEGWNVLNKAKTGKESGSLGAVKPKYTYNKCKEIALSCKSRKEFEVLNRSAYMASCRNNWINDWFEDKGWHEAGYWTYNRCMEIAKQVYNASSMQKINKSAYGAALRNGWLKDYTWWINTQKPRGYWTYDRCLEIAKQCKNKGQMSELSIGAYTSAKRNGWLDEWFPKRKKAA